MSGADAPTAGRFEGRAHLLPIRIYYEDTDFSGAVYHANYLRYLERARSDFVRLVGIDHTTLLALDPPIAFAVTEMRLAFKRAARIDDALLVRTTFDHVRGPRLAITQAIERAAEVVAEASVEACCVSLDGRARRPPPLLVERLGPLLAPASSF